MAGFTRRFSAFPGREVITQIEAAIIVDQPQPGVSNGSGTGTTCIVGEFADMSNSVVFDGSGVLTSRPRAVEVFGSTDAINKFGGWEETLGEFGGDQGSGFHALRNKRFSRLILIAADLVTNSGTTGGTRFWRELPTNKSATDATPIVPVSAGVLLAGRQFVSGANRVRVAQRVVFADDVAKTSAVNGTTSVAAAAVVQDFDRAAGSFITDGVVVGDILALGVIGASGAQGSNAGTYRVVGVTSATRLSVERMDGTAFAFAAAVGTLAWRIHRNRTADSAEVIANVSVALGTSSGYVVPSRPLDATVAAATLVTPSVVPPAGTATSWDALSGLTGRTHPTNALTYLAAVHAPNSANNSTIDARYQLAIEALLTDEYPARDIKIVVAARKSTVIRSALRTHVGVASERGLTRRTIMAPSLDTVSLATVIGDTDPGVGANRAERADYSWPGAQSFVPEAEGFSVLGADGRSYTTGILDESFDVWLASIESLLPPERNPGQAAEPVPTILAPVLGFQRGLVTALSMPEYIQLRQKGVAALRMDRVVGPIIQSGITTSLIAGEKNILRRRMADFIQDSLADLSLPYLKLPQSEQRKGDVVAAYESFLAQLLSEDNPSAQRIAAFALDPVSGNTPESEAAGIFVVITAVRLLSTLDDIVIQSSIGENVDVTLLAAA